VGSRVGIIAVGGVPLAVADGASLGFIAADGLGSPRVVTSAAGAVLWSWPYVANPFGEAQPVSATGYVLNLRFPGQYQDNEAGLKYNVNRTFDAPRHCLPKTGKARISGRSLRRYQHTVPSPPVSVQRSGGRFA